MAWLKGQLVSNAVRIDKNVSFRQTVDFVSPPELGESTGTFTDRIALTNANVKALRATPITLVAAPGAGKMLLFHDIVLFLDYGGTNVFTESTDNLAVKYTDGSGIAVSQSIETTGWIDQSADTYTRGLAKIDAIAATAGCVNQALVLHNTGDGEIAGNAGNDNVVIVYVTYSVLTIS